MHITFKLTTHTSNIFFLAKEPWFLWSPWGSWILPPCKQKSALGQRCALSLNNTFPFIWIWVYAESLTDTEVSYRLFTFVWPPFPQIFLVFSLFHKITTFVRIPFDFSSTEALGWKPNGEPQGILQNVPPQKHTNTFMVRRQSCIYEQAHFHHLAVKSQLQLL